MDSRLCRHGTRFFVPTSSCGWLAGYTADVRCAQSMVQGLAVAPTDHVSRGLHPCIAWVVEVITPRSSVRTSLDVDGGGSAWQARVQTLHQTRDLQIRMFSDLRVAWARCASYLSDNVGSSSAYFCAAACIIKGLKKRRCHERGRPTASTAQKL